MADRPSASPLRLPLRPAGAGRIQIQVIKRRGPRLLTPLTLELPPVLSDAAKRRSNAVALSGREVAESRAPSLS